MTASGTFCTFQSRRNPLWPNIPANIAVSLQRLKSASSSLSPDACRAGFTRITSRRSPCSPWPWPARLCVARWDVRTLWVVVVALAVNWFGDSLDGTVARVRHVERPRYGFYVDHVLDIVGATFLFAGGGVGIHAPIIALSLLIAYLLVSGEVFLATSVSRRLPDVLFRLRSDRAPNPARGRDHRTVWDPHVNLGALGQMRLSTSVG